MTSPIQQRTAQGEVPTVSSLSSEQLRKVALSAVSQCRAGNWQKGFPVLRHLLYQNANLNSMPGIFYAFLGYGLASRERQYKVGLDLCKTGVRMSEFEGETHLYLARTYMLLGSKKQAISALDRGLRVNPNNPWLLQMRQEFGWRRPPLVHSLSRNHVVNRAFGEVRSRVTKPDGPPRRKKT